MKTVDHFKDMCIHNQKSSLPLIGQTFFYSVTDWSNTFLFRTFLLKTLSIGQTIFRFKRFFRSPLKKKRFIKRHGIGET